MEFLDKKKRFQVILTSVIYISMIVISVICLYNNGSRLKSIYILNEGVDILGMLVGYVLFASCLIDVQKTRADYRYFIYLLNITLWGLFLDSCAWMVDGIKDYALINSIINTLYYMVSPMAACLFWLYVIRYLDLDNKVINTISRIIQIGIVLSLAVRIINMFGGFYFYIENGTYHRAGFYMISLIYTYVTMFITLIIAVIYRKKTENYKIVALFIYSLAPLIVGLVTARIYGLSIVYGIVMVAILFMYCVINVDQGRDKAVADRELLLAANIQENILPRSFPFLPEKKEFDLYASMTPAKEVGGDFYDFFMIDDEHLVISVADVSGKGIPAALFMMVARTVIKNHILSTKNTSPAEIFTTINNQLCEGNDLNLFVTVWLGILNINTGVLKFSNAGHGFPAVSRDYGDFELVKGKISPPLATVEGIRYTENEVKLRPKDAIFIYTDGVTEATNNKKELFGTENMLRALNINTKASPTQLDEKVRKEIKKFVKKEPQFDDITMLCIRYYGKNSENES